MIHMLDEKTRLTKCGLNPAATPIRPPMDGARVWSDGIRLAEDGGSERLCPACEPRVTGLKRYDVFSVRKTKAGTEMHHAGMAIENRDGTVEVHLDMLPLDGHLQLRRKP